MHKKRYKVSADFSDAALGAQIDADMNAEMNTELNTQQ